MPKIRVLARLMTSILVLVSVSMLAAMATQADPAAITAVSTGDLEGSYFTIGKRLQNAMRAGHGVRIDVVTSSGSVQNLSRLADPASDVGLALAQADALSQFLESDPRLADQFIVLGDVGKECAMLIAGNTSKVRSLSDLTKTPGAEISVDGFGSGAGVTLGYLQTTAPAFKRTKAVHVDSMEALLQIKLAGPLTRLKAVMLVQRPSTRSAPIRILLEKPDDYHLIPIQQADVTEGSLPDGSGVYTFEKVRVGGGEGASSLEVQSICTRGLLLASKRKLARDLRSKLAVTMLESSKKIIDLER